MPKLTMPGAVLVGDAGGMVNLASLKGRATATVRALEAVVCRYG
jgi:flavin-dependent dehydrogenase